MNDSEPMVLDIPKENPPNSLSNAIATATVRVIFVGFLVPDRFHRRSDANAAADIFVRRSAHLSGVEEERFSRCG
jgi:hypothetical protein